MSGFSRRTFLQSSAAMTASSLISPLAFTQNRKPNIVWIVVEDMSTHFSCYGETTIETPHIDRLAREGVKFNQAFITCPVCSPSRSAMITGMYQTTIGAQHHRSGRGKLKIYLPTGVRPIPELFREHGYFTCNGNLNGKKGKTDYNFEFDPALYDGSDWSQRKDDQPFFAQIQLHGGKLRHNAKWVEQSYKTLDKPVYADDVSLPPYYPDDPVIREDWAQYLNTVQQTDLEAGQIVQRLRDEGLLDNTYIFFITDHGISHARGKQFLYEEGIHIPFIVRGPGLEADTERDDLIVHIDMAATSLALAGIEIPDSMQAKDILSENYQPRPWIVSARDRCDETVDRIRCVRTEHYKYIRNFYPQRPYLQPNRYKDAKPIIQTIRRLDQEGKLNEVQSLVTAATRPPEELYDLQNDPWEIHNLAAKAEDQDMLERLRAILDRWIVESGDKSQQPESPEMYDSDMEVYLTTKPPEQAKILARNIKIMKQWAAEGK